MKSFVFIAVLFTKLASAQSIGVALQHDLLTCFAARGPGGFVEVVLTPSSSILTIGSLTKAYRTFYDGWQEVHRIYEKKEINVAYGYSTGNRQPFRFTVGPGVGYQSIDYYETGTASWVRRSDSRSLSANLVVNADLYFFRDQIALCGVVIPEYAILLTSSYMPSAFIYVEPFNKRNFFFIASQLGIKFNLDAIKL